MKELKYALMYASISQMLLWLIFMVFDELIMSDYELYVLYFGISLLIVLFILYFIHNNEIIKNHKLKSMKFKVFEYSIWTILSVAMMIITLILIDNRLLHPCSIGGWDCFLNGLEYQLYAICMLIFIVLIIVIEIIIYFVKKIKHSNK